MATDTSERMATLESRLACVEQLVWGHVESIVSLRSTSDALVVDMMALKHMISTPGQSLRVSDSRFPRKPSPLRELGRQEKPAFATMNGFAEDHSSWGVSANMNVRLEELRHLQTHIQSNSNNCKDQSIAYELDLSNLRDACAKHLANAHHPEMRTGCKVASTCLVDARASSPSPGTNEQTPHGMRNQLEREDGERSRSLMRGDTLFPRSHQAGGRSIPIEMEHTVIGAQQFSGDSKVRSENLSLGSENANLSNQFVSIPDERSSERKPHRTCAELLESRPQSRKVLGTHNLVPDEALGGSDRAIKLVHSIGPPSLQMHTDGCTSDVSAPALQNRLVQKKSLDECTESSSLLERVSQLEETQLRIQERLLEVPVRLDDVQITNRALQEAVVELVKVV